MPATITATRNDDKNSTADHISPASLTTPRGAHLVTVIVLSRSHLVLAKIGSKTTVELTVQRGHIPWILTAQAAATDQGEDPCGFRTINTIAFAAVLGEQYSPCCPRMLCRSVE